MHSNDIELILLIAFMIGYLNLHLAHCQLCCEIKKYIHLVPYFHVTSYVDWFSLFYKRTGTKNVYIKYVLRFLLFEITVLI